MKIPSTLLHHHHVLPRRIPAVSFPLSLPTPVKRQTLSPRLLQFRSSSSSGSNDVDFQKDIHRLIAAQRTVDREQSKGGFTSKGRPAMSGIIQRARTLSPEEVRGMLDQYNVAERERWTILGEMLQKEVTRLDPSDTTKMQSLMGPKKTTKFARLILERAAEPSHRLTPNDLKTLENALLHLARRAENGLTSMKVIGFTLGAGLLYYVYSITNWSP